MSLVNKKSIYDRHVRMEEGSNVGLTNPNQGAYYLYEGTTTGDKDLRPFKSMNANLGEDQLVDLLRDFTVNSANTGLSYKPEEMRTGNRPSNPTAPSGEQDFDGADNGQGIFTIGHLQGKKVKGNDLHVHLLGNENHYVYNHGGSYPGSQALIQGSPANVGDFQDFIDSLDPLTEYPGSNSSLGQFGGPYNTTGPSDGFY